MRGLHKGLAATAGLAAVTTVALVGRRRRRPTLQQQAAQIRKQYRQVRSANDLHSRAVKDAHMDAMRDLNDLRVRHMKQMGGPWDELSALDKFRISVEFGTADPEAVCVEKEPGALTLTKTNEERVREQVKRMLDRSR